jgi:hypothetical protein
LISSLNSSFCSSLVSSLITSVAISGAIVSYVAQCEIERLRVISSFAPRLSTSVYSAPSR